MNRVVVSAVLAAGCGRVGFDAVAVGDGGAGGDTVPLGQHRAFVKASNPDVNDQFGLAVAMSRDGLTLAVGAPLESSSARTIGGDQADNSALEMGAVYVFRRSGDVWAQEEYIKPPNGDAGDQFGWSVALSADGNTLVAGARKEASNGTPSDNSLNDAGAAYVFVRSGTTWAPQAYLKASNVGAQDQFGERVAISDDGTTIAVAAPTEASASTVIDAGQADDTAPNAGAVYVFTRAGATWTQQSYLKAFNTDAEDQFGYDIALSATGDTLVVGAFREASASATTPTDDSLMYAGAAYVFTRTAGMWTQASFLKASNPDIGDNFGYSVAIAADGLSVLVGAPSESSRATGIDGDQADNSAQYSGAVYLFRGPAWTQQTYVKASNPDPDDEFGYCVAMSAAADVIAASADGESSTAIDLDGDQTVNSAVSAGAGYLYARDGSWSQRHYLKASNSGAGDNFGWACAMSGAGDAIAIGAPFEDGGNAGIDPASDEAAMDAGAVYLFY